MVIDELIAILGYDVQGEENLKHFNSGLKEATENAQALAERLGKGVAIAGAALAAGMAFLGKGVIATGSSFENLSIRLETIEGSAEGAAKALEWINQFAADSPLTIDQTADAYARLKTYGLDPTNGTLLTLVDTMAAAGKTAVEFGGIALAVGQMWTKNRIQTEEMNQLNERGIPAWNLLADATGRTVEQLMDLAQKGALGRKEIKLLLDAMQKRYGGASAKMAKAWSGLVARLEDGWTRFKRLIADSGFFDDAKRLLEEFVASIEQSFQDGRAKKAAQFLSDMLSDTIRVIGLFARQSARHIQFIIDNIDTLRPYIHGLAAVFGVLLAATFPITTALVALGLAFDDFLTYLEGGQSVFGDVVKWLTDMTGLPEKAAAAFTGLGAVILAALGIGLLAILPAAMGSLAAGIVGLLATSIGALTGTLVGGFAGLFAFMLTPAGWAVILAGAGAALVAYFWDDIVSAAPKLVSAGVAMGKALIEGIKSVGSGIADWFASQIPDWAKMIFGGNGPSPARGAFQVGSSPVDNFNANMAKVNGAGASAVVTDNRQFPVSVEAPVTVNVQQASQAPGAVGNAVAGAINQAVQAQPSRMQAGPVAQ